MRPRLLVLLCILLVAGGCGHGPAPRTRLRTRIDTPATLVATTTTTTTSPPPPVTAALPARQSVKRVSRAGLVSQPRPAPLGDGSCGDWGYKSRARSDECWGPAVEGYGDWPAGRMLTILYCESHGNPWVVNASGHVGLFQIAQGWSTKGDGPGNIGWAHDMWLRSGTAPWRQCGG